MTRPVAAAVAALTALGFALRYPGIHQSVFGDEIYTLRIVREDGLGGVLDRVTDTESTPPLYYVVAWLTAQLGDDLVWARVPSLVFGTLAIPATWVLGVRTLGERAGLVGAAIVALAPTAIFYSSEARAYAMVLFLVVLALVLLLGARWVLFAIVAAAALYTHYTAALPLAAAVLWALWQWPERRRQVLLASGAAVVAYLPWLPQLGSNELLELSPKLSFDSALRFTGRLLPGHPYVTLPDVPGEVALVLLGLAVGVAFGALVARRRELPRARPELTLLLLVALATPVGLLAYSLVSTDIFQTRNLLPSLPAFALLLGALLTAPRGRLAIATSGAAVIAIAVGGVATAFDDDNRRPPYKDAAEWIEERQRPGDAAADVPLFLIHGPDDTVLTNHLSNQTKAHVALPTRQRDGAFVPVLPDEALGARRVFLVSPDVGGGFSVPEGGPPGPTVVFNGFIDVGVFEYPGR